MTGPRYSVDDYRQAFQNLLPRGPAWPRDPASMQFALAAGLATMFEQVDSDANALLVDTFPSTAVNFLSVWEQTLGLPDSCCGSGGQTIAQRQQQVLAKFAYSGGQSVAYFVAVAALLGYTISITQFAPFRAGASCAGQPTCSPAWSFAWQVNGITVFHESFHASADTAGTPVEMWGTQAFQAGAGAGAPLAVWGQNPLLCKFNKLAPAHTVIVPVIVEI